MFGEAAEEKLHDVNVFCTIKRSSSMKNNAGNDRGVASYITTKKEKKNKITTHKRIPWSFLCRTTAFPEKKKRKNEMMRKKNKQKKCRLSSIFYVFFTGFIGEKLKGVRFYKR